MARLGLALYVLLHGHAPTHEPDREVPGREASGGRDDPMPVALPDRATERLIDLRDNVLIAAGSGGGPELTSVARQLQDVLRMTGVEIFDDTGALDDLRHHIAGTVATGDAGLDRTIAESIRSGCSRDGAVFRRQQVLVYELQGDDGA